MLFGVYADAPPPRRGANPWLIGIAGCGGCIVIVVVALLGAGFLGLTKLKAVGGQYEQQPVKMQMFLGLLKEHNYGNAVDMLSEDAKKKLSAKQLETIVESTEKKVGKIQGWSSWESHTNGGEVAVQAGQGDLKVNNNGTTSKLIMPVRCARGNATATFVFRSEDPLKPSTYIDTFELKPEAAK